MHFEVFSLFPQYIEEPLKQSILKKAIEKGLIRVTCEDIRSYSPGKRVDDLSYGGGPGMVLMAEPIIQGIERKKSAKTKVIYLSPQGRRLTPQFARELAQEEHLILLAGHYEGIDARAIEEIVDMELSIGDYVLTNGCLAALLVIDVVSRYIPGVLGDSRASEQDSFESALLDFPHYTRPEVFDSKSVPKVLLSGNHEKIRKWRYHQSLQATWDKRPDLFASAVLSSRKNKEKNRDEKSSINLQQLAVPATLFSLSIPFYRKLFQMEPLFEEQEGVEKAIWLLHGGSFQFILYNLGTNEETSIPQTLPGIVFEYVVTKEALIQFLLWLSKKKQLGSSIIMCEIEKSVKDSIIMHIEEKKKIVIIDPSGHRIMLNISYD